MCIAGIRVIKNVYTLVTIMCIAGIRIRKNAYALTQILCIADIRTIKNVSHQPSGRHVVEQQF